MRAIDEEPLETSRTDRMLDAHRKTAPNYRQLAYELLKDTMNVDYVHARYAGQPGLEGLTKENLNDALEMYKRQLENGIEKPRFVHQHTARNRGRARLVPQTDDTAHPADVLPERATREPGEDDDKE